jgi:hypothetical protein
MLILDYVIYRIVAVILKMFWNKIVLGSRLYNTRGYIWEKYRSSEITFGFILKINLPLYKGFTLKITNKWWPLTTLNRSPLYQIKIYSKMHLKNTKVTVMSKWPLYKGDRYDRFDCTIEFVYNEVQGTLDLSSL